MTPGCHTRSPLGLDPTDTHILDLFRIPPNPVVTNLLPQTLCYFFAPGFQLTPDIRLADNLAFVEQVDAFAD